MDASDTERLARSPPLPTGSKPLATVFFGESNLLTLVPGRPRQEEPLGSQNDKSQTKARPLFPLNTSPRPILEGEPPTSVEHLSIGVLRYLRDEGALMLPDLQACIPGYKHTLPGFTRVSQYWIWQTLHTNFSFLRSHRF
jgi:hypothetical protein